jgi:CelD/BcsL family acetyltransferase involved in cellulose biosynthesis
MSVAAMNAAVATAPALQAGWNELLWTSPSDSIFLRAEWISAWKRIHPCGNSAFDVNVENGSLKAAAALYPSSYRLLGTLPFTILRQSGDAMSGAEYADWLGEDADAIQQIAERLDQRGDWDCIWLPNLADWTGATARISKAAVSRDWHVRRRSRTFAYLELPSTFHGYWDSLGENRRSQLKRQKAKVRDAEFVLCDNGNDLHRMLDALFDLNAKRWATKGLQGTFVRKPLEARFYREFAPVALANGWLWLCGLRHKDRWLAIQYGYRYNGCYLQMQEGFDPEAPDGAGNALRLLAIEQMISAGTRHYDFLGEMTEHKRRWGAQLRWGSDLFIGRNRLKNRLLFGPKTIWPTGRYLRLQEVAA